MAPVIDREDEEELNLGFEYDEQYAAEKAAEIVYQLTGE